MAIHLYLDTTVFCRPFDNQLIGRVRVETNAFQRILEKLEQNEANLVSSEIDHQRRMLLVMNPAGFVEAMRW